MGKEIATQVEETQRVPNRKNPRQNTLRHILIKLMKIKKKDHEKILEEIIVENFPKMRKEIITQVQETQRINLFTQTG